MSMMKYGIKREIKLNISIKFFYVDVLVRKRVNRLYYLSYIYFFHFTVYFCVVHVKENS